MVPDVPDYWLEQAKANARINAVVSTDPRRVVVCYDPLCRGFKMFFEDAWIKPDERGLLPWTPPAERLVKCVTVDRYGTVTRC